MGAWGRLKSKKYSVSLDPITAYKFRCTVLLTLVPMICCLLLFFLLLVFTKLNLYYMETNGLLVNQEIREAYYQVIDSELLGTLGYFLLEIVVTAIVSFVVMGWATSPFKNAEKTLRVVLSNGAVPAKPSRFLSESPAFDHVFASFSNRIRSGGENPLKNTSIRHPQINFLFLAKFVCVYFILSAVAGLVMGAALTSTYSRIVTLALALLPGKNVGAHYFLAQQEILSQASFLLASVALVVYLLLGWQISRYMATMLFVFIRAVKEERFPLSLRNSDIYHSLAKTINEAAKKL